MKYRSYQTEDYLQDPQFIDWVRHPTPEKSAFWQEWMKSYPEHRERILAAREIIVMMHFNSLEPTEDEFQEVLKNILRGEKSFPGLRMDAPKRGRTFTLRKVHMRVAILFLCVSAAVFWIATLRTSNENASHTQVAQVIKKTKRGQKLSFVLPDGSKVLLNAESEISYQEAFSGHERAIALKGEAFFEVAKDTTRPFIVKAGGLYTRALGTAFNVQAYDDAGWEAVSLTHGKVEVGSLQPQQEKYMLILYPGEKARYQPVSQELHKDRLDYQADVAWKEGVIYFKDAGFEEVVNRLERWYDVNFIVTEEPVVPWHYNGSFTNAHLEKVLERLAYIQGFSYRIQEKNVYLTLKH